MNWSDPAADPWRDIQAYHTAYNAVVSPRGSVVSLVKLDEARQPALEPAHDPGRDPNLHPVYPPTCSCSWRFCECAFDWPDPERRSFANSYTLSSDLGDALAYIYRSLGNAAKEQSEIIEEWWEYYEERRKSRERPAHAGPPPPPKPVPALSSVHFPRAHRRPGHVLR